MIRRRKININRKRIVEPKQIIISVRNSNSNNKANTISPNSQKNTKNLLTIKLNNMAIFLISIIARMSHKITGLSLHDKFNKIRNILFKIIKSKRVLL